MLESWGRYPRPERQEELRLDWRDQPLPEARPLLAYGRGRSYGDCCLNDGGALVQTRGLDRFISLQPDGVVRCEAGVTLGEILELSVPRGWFLPVVPGTKHVTVGGAIANDIHGKNHHRRGTFGAHLRRFELLRSDGRGECVPGDALFAATVGGLGLTGVVTWAEIQLRPVPGPAVRVESVPFRTLDEFFALGEASDAEFEYTVAWVDALRPGRGVLFRGEHADGAARPPRPPLEVPIRLPAVNGLSIRAFNLLYASVQRRASKLVHFDPFFFPLDAARHWNRLYGKNGFLQFQCVVPGREHVQPLFAACQGQPSALGVLKKFGDAPSPGLCSFPRPGFTLALDFPNRGAPTFALFERLERVAIEAGGAVYPAKDARMSRASFAASFPRVGELEKLRDPAFSSSLWRRCAS
jgi:FAD/FMN-containing dehydrogenase